MYGKIFAQIFDSSIADDYHLRHFFMDLIVLADSDGVVNMTPASISCRTRIPLPDVLGFLKRLSEPDVMSQSPDAEGRRIELIDDHRAWGWHIINYEKYRNFATEEQRRLKTRERVKRFKLKRKQLEQGNAEVTQGNAEVTPPYAYAYTSSCVGIEDSKGERVSRLRALVNVLMKRNAAQRWKYEDERLLVEISGRDECLKEFTEIEGYLRKKEKKNERQFFPRSVSSLLSGWDKTLDQARTEPATAPLSDKIVSRFIPQVSV